MAEGRVGETKLDLWDGQSWPSAWNGATPKQTPWAGSCHKTPGAVCLPGNSGRQALLWSHRGTKGTEAWEGASGSEVATLRTSSVHLQIAPCLANRILAVAKPLTLHARLLPSCCQDQRYHGYLHWPKVSPLGGLWTWHQHVSPRQSGWGPVFVF